MSTCDFEDCVGQGWWGMAQACSCLTNADITRYDLWTWQMWRLTGLSVGQEAFVERFLNIFSEKMHWTRLSQHKEDSIDFNWWQSTKEETTNSMKNYNHNIHAFDVVDQLSMCVCVCAFDKSWLQYGTMSGQGLCNKSFFKRATATKPRMILCVNVCVGVKININNWRKDRLN